MAGIFTVTQVNHYIKNMFTQDFLLNRLRIKGEVSNLKYHASGHIYFTLKDGNSQIMAVMFAGNRGGLNFRLEEGQAVVVNGSVDVYERDGRYQIYAKIIEQEGRGELFLRFEQLKKEMAERGLFAPEYKQPIPKYIRTLGVVTAPEGAAIRDILQIAKRRNPYVQVVLYPALVQGTQAAVSIVKGISTLDSLGLDVIIVGRGGGSIEDLWPFNEESVAEAIFNADTPVISAVGHETDTTIADFVADLRAPTPSAAAELAVFDVNLLLETLESVKYRMQYELKKRIKHEKLLIERIELKLKQYSPERRINEKRQRVSDIAAGLKEQMDLGILKKRHALALAGEKLNGLSPLLSLAQGFAYTEIPESRQRIRSVDMVDIGDDIRVYYPDGSLTASVIRKQKKEGQKHV